MKIKSCFRFCVFFISLVVGGVPIHANDSVQAPSTSPLRVPLLLRSLENTQRLLYVTAHPDDEDAALLCRLRYRHGVETALLTLTRGEGGQNEIGSELGAALGVVRSRELEAAQRFYGARQYFSRAIDFGYSFSVEETYDKWGPDPVLRDIVAVLREFRPDVIITLPADGDGGRERGECGRPLARQQQPDAERQHEPHVLQHRQVEDDRAFHDEGGAAHDEGRNQGRAHVGGDGAHETYVLSPLLPT